MRVVRNLQYAREGAIEVGLKDPESHPKNFHNDMKNIIFSSGKFETSIQEFLIIIVLNLRNDDDS